jgi:hypothetical protein
VSVPLSKIELQVSHPYENKCHREPTYYAGDIDTQPLLQQCDMLSKESKYILDRVIFNLNCLPGLQYRLTDRLQFDMAIR